MTSTITFPPNDTPNHNSDKMSVLSRQATALEICDMVYGNSNPDWEAIEQHYEASAVYENPFLTATSREILADISSLTRQLSEFDIPKPVAMLHTLFRLRRSEKMREPWFRALEVWTEVDEILESDSFDGHRRTIIEHTLNVLILPGLHSARPHGLNLPTSDTFENYQPTLDDDESSPPRPEPTMSFVGVPLPSPLHLKLRILTRLSLNERGRITHHRDFWDVKDLFGLVPGVSLTQWITTRMTGYSLALLSRAGSWVFGRRDTNRPAESGRKEPETGRRTRSNSELTTAAAYARHVRMHTHGSFSSSRA